MSTPSTSRQRWLAAGALASILAVVACQGAAQGTSAPAAAPVAPVRRGQPGYIHERQPRDSRLRQPASG